MPDAPTMVASREATRPTRLDRDFLRAFAQTRSFRLGAPTAMTPTPDGKRVLFLRSGPRDTRQALFELDLETGATRELLSPEAVAAGPETLSPEERARRERQRIFSRGFTSFALDQGGARVLVMLSGRAYVLSRDDGKVRELPTGDGAIVDPQLSPDGTRLAFVKGGELHVARVDGTGGPVAVTHGAPGTTRGLAEFVAQEELSRASGFAWSPDSAHLLFEEVDESKVEELTIADPGRPEVPPERYRYPRAGRANAETRFGVVSAGGGKATWITWDQATFPYVAKVTWEAGMPPLLVVLDRLQRRARLLAVDVASGGTEVLVEESDAAFVNHDPSLPRVIDGGRAFLWSSERSGTWQLELRDRRGGLLRELTSGALGYDKVIGVDEARQLVYVTAGAEPTELGVYAIPLDPAAGVVRRVAGGQGVLATAVARPGRGPIDVLAVAETSRGALPRFVARAADGRELRAIPDATETPPFVPRVEIAKVGPDQVRVAIVRPRDHLPGQKRPVIDAAYGGPHALVAAADAHRYLRAQWIADTTGAIVVSIDARGTPRRGRDWERAIYTKLGSVPLEGHVDTLRALGDRYPEMDLTRVGVYGWSFGGYFAALAALSRPDVYRVAVAGAPVVDWRDYDTTYTERYMGLPSAERAAYDAASVLSHVAGSARPRLLVIHGTADDNVYFLHALKLADALVRAGKPFELLPLVGTTHMLVEPEIHEAAWTRAAEFLRDGLW